MEESLKEAVLRFHGFPVPGKVSATLTKSLSTSQDLALVCSPGVAAPCTRIYVDPQNTYKCTAKGNLVTAISSDTAVLGLGGAGASAGGPVVEDKGVLFKRFVGVDVFDIEINEKDPQKLVDIIAALGPTFGGINLEDTRAPGCFYIERKLRKCYGIPVFHGNQHDTAIIIVITVLNVLRFIGRSIEEATLVYSSMGTVVTTCLNRPLALGLKRENVIVCDSRGVIHKTHEDKDRVDEPKRPYAIESNGQRALADAVKNKDIFPGLSGANPLTPEMLSIMNVRPTMFTIANSNPEILSPLARETRSGVIIGAGRSGFSDQVNNVLYFPFTFRDASDVGATTTNEEIKLACVHALAGLVMEGVSEEVVTAYDKKSGFGTDYLIPIPFNRRLISRVATTTVKTAMESGMVTRSITDLATYIAKLEAAWR